jgi:KTSC domain
MDTQPHAVKMASVESDLFESVGYDDGSRCMIVKFRNAPTMRFEKVPRFRYQGLLSAVRKDAYYKTFIKDQFLSKTIQPSV